MSEEYIFVGVAYSAEREAQIVAHTTELGLLYELTTFSNAPEDARDINNWEPVGQFNRSQYTYTFDAVDGERTLVIKRVRLKRGEPVEQ